MSSDTSNISNSPGLILRTAREELKYSIDHVAHDLHLRACVVESMENENYDDFSSDVFLKGYFRSYCRLVNLHEERMVELLEAQLKSRKDEIESVALNAKREEKAKLRKKVTGITAALALVGSLTFYVLVYLLPNGNAQPELQQIVSTQFAENEAIPDTSNKQEVLVSEVEQVKERNLGQETPEAQRKEVNPPVTEVKQEVPVPQPMNAAETLANEKKVKAVSGEAEAAREESVNVGAVSSLDAGLVIDKPVAKSSFVANFTGDCWFKFTNAEGKTVFAALKRAGEKVTYNGVAPFTIVFGDAKQVSVTFEGNSVDLKPYTAKNGRAQVTLKPAS